MESAGAVPSLGFVDGKNMESCIGATCKEPLVARWPMIVGGVQHFLFWKSLNVFMGLDLVAM